MIAYESGSVVSGPKFIVPRQIGLTRERGAAETSIFHVIASIAGERAALLRAIRSVSPDATPLCQASAPTVKLPR